MTKEMIENRKLRRLGIEKFKRECINASPARIKQMEKELERFKQSLNAKFNNMRRAEKAKKNAL